MLGDEPVNGRSAEAGESSDLLQAKQTLRRLFALRIADNVIERLSRLKLYSLLQQLSIIYSVLLKIPFYCKTLIFYAKR